MTGICEATLIGGSQSGKVWALREEANDLVMDELDFDNFYWADYPEEIVPVPTKRVVYSRVKLNLFGRPGQVFVRQGMSEDERNRECVQLLLSDLGRGVLL